MPKLGGYVVHCVVEEYRDGWRSVMRVSRWLPSQARSGTTVQYAVPALFHNELEAVCASYRWASRLIESDPDNVEFALANAELDDALVFRH